MPSKPVYLVSDIHLGAVPPETETAFRRFLDHVKESGSRLIINGDLFDFWFEYGRVISNQHVRVLAALADLVDAGIPVTLLGGNHDWWGGAFLTETLGVSFHQDPVRVDLLGRRVLLAHGDGLGSGDLRYRVLRLTLRNRVVRWLFRWVHPDIGAWVADRVSDTEARTREPNGRVKARADALLAWGTHRLSADPDLEIVALGHTHWPEVVETTPGRYYVNSGDWVRHRSYVTIHESGVPELQEWSG